MPGTKNNTPLKTIEAVVETSEEEELRSGLTLTIQLHSPKKLHIIIITVS